MLGNLWVGNFNDNKIMRFDAAQLTSSGAMVPTVVLTPEELVEVARVGRALEDEFGRTFDDEISQKIKTIGDAVDAIVDAQ